MTKSEMFKKAHGIARNTVSVAGDYLVAFSLALKSIYAEITNMVKSMEKKLIDLGLSVWEGGAHRRIYINECLVDVFGLSINYYGSGSIRSARLNGEKISNTKAGKLLSGNPYYDCNADKFVGIELPAII